MYDMPAFLPMTSIGVIVAAFVAAIGLFFAFVFKRKPKANIQLCPIDSRQDLSGNEANYFSYIKYDQSVNALVLKQSQVFKKCVVTLIIKRNGSISSKRYNLSYANNDLSCGITLNGQIDEYKVVLESVDGAVQKHAPIDNVLAMNIIYAAIVSIIFAIGAGLYIVMCSYYLNDEWVGYAFYYTYIALVLIYIIVVVGGFALGEVLAKKGKF